VAYAEEIKFTTSTCLFIAMIVWVNNFHSNTKNLSHFEQLFCEGNDIARGSNRGGCWEVQDELNIGV